MTALVAVRFGQQVVHGVVSVTLTERRGEGYLRNPPQRVVGKLRFVVRRVGDGHHVVFRVVTLVMQVLIADSKAGASGEPRINNSESRFSHRANIPLRYRLEDTEWTNCPKHAE
jgi:hypothetical protein